MDLMLATSKAGHDKNHVYVIIGDNADYYFLANGETKLIETPKKKKKIHVQIIKNIPSDVRKIADEANVLTDLSIKRILKEFNRRIENV